MLRLGLASSRDFGPVDRDFRGNAGQGPQCLDTDCASFDVSKAPEVLELVSAIFSRYT